MLLTSVFAHRFHRTSCMSAELCPHVRNGPVLLSFICLNLYCTVDASTSICHWRNHLIVFPIFSYNACMVQPVDEVLRSLGRLETTVVVVVDRCRACNVQFDRI